MSSNCHKILIPFETLPDIVNALNKDGIKKIVWSATKDYLKAEIFYESYDEIIGPSWIKIPFHN